MIGRVSLSPQNLPKVSPTLPASPTIIGSVGLQAMTTQENGVTSPRNSPLSQQNTTMANTSGYVGWSTSNSLESNSHKPQSPRKNLFGAGFCVYDIESDAYVPPCSEVLTREISSSDSSPDFSFRYPKAKQITNKLQKAKATPMKIQENKAPLRLNFAYRRQFLKKSFTDISALDNSLSSSSDEEENLTAGSWQIKKRLREPQFKKFIPISTHVAVMTVPKLLLNEKDPCEWEEAHTALLESMQDRVEKSQSNMFVVYSPEKVRRKRGTLKKFFSCAALGSPHKQSKFPFGVVCDNIDKCSIYDREYLPNFSAARFNYNLNQKYMEVAAAEKPDFTVVLYAHVDEDDPNFEQCHIQTELCVAAMLNFFHPWSDVQCLWISNMQHKISSLLTDKTLKAKFTRLVYLRTFEAVLVVSADAGCLLRHKHLCFLHSLAATLQINTSKLLVLVKYPPSQQNPKLDTCTVILENSDITY